MMVNWVWEAVVSYHLCQACVQVSFPQFGKHFFLLIKKIDNKEKCLWHFCGIMLVIMSVNDCNLKVFLVPFSQLSSGKWLVNTIFFEFMSHNVRMWSKRKKNTLCYLLSALMATLTFQWFSSTCPTLFWISGLFEQIMSIVYQLNYSISNDKERRNKGNW